MAITNNYDPSRCFGYFPTRPTLADISSALRTFHGKVVRLFRGSQTDRAQTQALSFPNSDGATVSSAERLASKSVTLIKTKPLDEGPLKEQVNDTSNQTASDGIVLSANVSAKRQVADGGNGVAAPPEIVRALQAISPESTVEEISLLLRTHQNIDVTRAENFAKLYEPGKINLEQVVKFADMRGQFSKVDLSEVSRILTYKRNKSNKERSPYSAAKYVWYRMYMSANQKTEEIRPRNDSISSLVEPKMKKGQSIREDADIIAKSWIIYCSLPTVGNRLTYSQWLVASGFAQ